MKTKTTFTFLILFTLSFSACGGNDVAANANAKTALTDPPQDHVEDVPTAEPEQAPEEVEQPAETHAMQLFSGLIYKDGGALWQIGEEGQSVQVSSCAPTGFDSELSPDGAQMLYSEDGEIWKIDLSGCEATNLSNTADDWEGSPQYWRSQQGLVIFGLNPGWDSGLPASINLDGTNYRILDETGMPNYPAALSPNSSYMAYLSSDGPLIYNLADGARIPFDVNFYGMDSASMVRMDSPAWSADGTKLAWSATTQQGEDYDTWRMNLIVFDLTTQSHAIIFSYIPQGRDGWVPPAVWSPDGEWLAFNAWIEEPEGENGIWVVKADGSEQYMLRPAETTANTWFDQLTPPVWSPDSQTLAFTYAGEPATHYYVEVGVWKVVPLSMPGTALLVDWR